MKKRVILVPHVHWDREWFHTEPNFSIILNRQIDDLDKINFKYNFDGHTWAIDDYIKINKLPTNAAKNIKSGLTNIGPLYVQSDFYSSMIGTLETNLRIGKKITKKYGRLTNLVYIADSFGYHEQMPQIFNKHGFDCFVNWRGIKSEDKKISNLFYWNGIHKKSKMLTSTMAPYGGSINDKYFSTGYSLTFPYNIPSNKEEEEYKKLKKLYNDYLSTKSAWEDLNVYWIPVGHDWAPVPMNLPEIVKWLNKNDKKYKYEIGTYLDYFKSVKKEVIPTLNYSNLNYSGTSKIHRTIASNRYDIKKRFREAELDLYYKLEPLEIMYKKMGGKLMTPEYKNEKIYKCLLAASAHDSLGGCNNDETNRQALARINKVHDTILVYIDLILRDIKNNLNLKKNEYLIINQAPFKQDLMFFDKISSDKKYNLGYSDSKTNIFTSQIKDRSHNWGDSPKTYDIDIVVSAKNMEPFSYRIIELKEQKILPKKTFVSFKDENIIIRINEKEIKFRIRVEDDFGDEFDFSTNNKAKNINLKIFKIFKAIKLKNLIINSVKLEGIFKKTKVKFNLDIISDEKSIIVKATTNNKLKNARISLEFEEKKAILSRSLAFIEQKLDNIKDFKNKGYKDAPVNNYTNDGLVRLINKKINIFTSGTNEVEFKDGKTRIVLSRFPTYIGRSDLDYRPGVASGPRHLLPTEDAKLNKILEFNFKFTFDNPIKGLNEWYFKGNGKQGEQVNKLNNKLDYLHINNPKLKVNSKVKSKLVDHNKILIGLYRLREDRKISIVTANPLEKKINYYEPFEIKYENIKE